MADNDGGPGEQRIPFEGEAVAIHGPPSKHESERQERETRDQEYRDHDRAYKDRQLAIEARQLTTNRRLAIYTSLLVILGAIGNFIAWRSSEAALIAATTARDQLKEMVQTRKSSEIQNAKARLASESQSRAALEATIQQNQLDQRAWIGIKALDLSAPQAGQRLRSDVNIVNSGKTFALDVSLPGALQTSRIGLEDAIRRAKLIPSEIPHSGVLFPSIDVHIPGATREKLTNEQAIDIASGSLKVYTFGDITYTDIFGNRHVTHYCGHFVPDAHRFEDCGNTAN